MAAEESPETDPDKTRINELITELSQLQQENKRLQVLYYKLCTLLRSLTLTTLGAANATVNEAINIQLALETNTIDQINHRKKMNEAGQRYQETDFMING